MKQNIKNQSVQHLNSSHCKNNKNGLLGLKVTKMKRLSKKDSPLDQKHLTLKSIRASLANMFKPTKRIDRNQPISADDQKSGYINTKSSLLPATSSSPLEFTPNQKLSLLDQNKLNLVVNPAKQESFRINGPKKTSLNSSLRVRQQQTRKAQPSMGIRAVTVKTYRMSQAKQPVLHKKEITPVLDTLMSKSASTFTFNESKKGLTCYLSSQSIHV